MAAEQPSLHETDWMPLPRMRLTCKYEFQIQIRMQTLSFQISKYNSTLKWQGN